MSGPQDDSFIAARDLMICVRHWIEYLAVRLFFCWVQAIRIETCEWFAGFVGWLMTRCIPLRARVINDNLQVAFPHWPAERRRMTARRMWEHLFLMVCEIAQVPRKIHETNFRDYIQFAPGTRRELLQLLLDPRPITIVSGHFGNFEVGNYTTGLLGFPTFAVARPMDNPLLDRFFKQFRAAHGQTILPKQGSARQIAAALETGQSLAILCDQWGGNKGCRVDFFGQPTSCHKAIAVFPLSSGTPLVVSYAKRCERPMHFEIASYAVVDPANSAEGPNSVRELTQWYNSCLEDIIRVTPDQYWWLHRRWKGEPQRRSHRRAA